MCVILNIQGVKVRKCRKNCNHGYIVRIFRYPCGMRTLIIGCGYVGIALGAELTRQGHEVFGLRRTTEGSAELTAAGIKPLVADITKPGEFATLPGPFDWVVNCVSSTRGGVEEYRQVYLQGSRNLLEWLAAAPP